jgi:hypothetical protein
MEKAQRAEMASGASSTRCCWYCNIVTAINASVIQHLQRSYGRHSDQTHFRPRPAAINRPQHRHSALPEGTRTSIKTKTPISVFGESLSSISICD